MKLISMVEFVLEQAKLKNDAYELAHLLIDYANFLKQPLTLGMFVPAKIVNGEWVVLEEPKPEAFLGSEMIAYETHRMKCEEFKEAKDRVLFEGFEFSHDNNYNSVVRQKTHSRIKVEIQFRKHEKDVRIIVNSDYIHDCGSVERLIGLQTKPILTESAKKQILGS